MSPLPIKIHPPMSVTLPRATSEPLSPISTRELPVRAILFADNFALPGTVASPRNTPLSAIVRSPVIAKRPSRPRVTRPLFEMETAPLAVNVSRSPKVINPPMDVTLRAVSVLSSPRLMNPPFMKMSRLVNVPWGSEINEPLDIVTLPVVRVAGLPKKKIVLASMNTSPSEIVAFAPAVI